MSSVEPEFDPSRRLFLRARTGSDRSPIRPPWAVREELFIRQCDRCGDCLPACPDGLLRSGDGGFPVLSFRDGGCTFCRKCVDACHSGALSREVFPAIDLAATIDQSCLATQGILCRACGDECEHAAIRFRPALGGLTRVEVVAADCNGCGACVRLCPIGAIDMQHAAAAREVA